MTLQELAKELKRYPNEHIVKGFGDCLLLPNHDGKYADEVSRYVVIIYK